MFVTLLNLDEDASPDMWDIVSPLIWIDKVYGKLEVPVGFRTDLASIPRPFRGVPFLDPNGLSRRPAAAHDWLYAWRGWGKDKADQFLYDALIAEGASAAVARTFYLGVHWFGAHSWASDARALATRDFVTPQAYFAWIATQPHPALQGGK